MSKFFRLTVAALALASLSVAADVHVSPPNSTARKQTTPRPLNVRPAGMPKMIEAVKFEKLINPFLSEADLRNMALQNIQADAKSNRLKVPGLGYTDAPLLYGVKIFDYIWTQGTEYYDMGLYTIGASDGDVTPVSMGQNFYGREVSVVADDYMYCAVPLSDGSTYYYRNDLNNYTVYGPKHMYAATVMSSFQDFDSKQVYGCMVSSANSYYLWGIYDVDNATYTELSNLGGTAYMAVDQAYDGRIYAIDNEGRFGQLNKDTGAMTVISNTGLTATNKCGGAIDKTTNTFYYVYFHVNTDPAAYISDIYAIDLTTGQSTFVTTVDAAAEWAGIFIPRPPYAAKSPAAVTNFGLDFTEFNNWGYVEFTFPTTANDGTALEGSVSYRILFDGIEVMAGQGQPGDDFSRVVNLQENPNLEPDRRYTVTVEVSNEGGKGPSVSTERFFGQDEIGTVTNVQLRIEDNEFVLTWDKPVGKNGGYVDYDGRVAYDIYMYPGETLVAGDLNGNITEYRRAIPEGTAKGLYYFGIAPWVVSPGITAMRDEVFSNQAMYGSFDLPFSDNFGLDADASYTILNANGDDVTWEQGPNYATCSYNASMAMDDWMITGPIEIPANSPLKITLSAGNNGYDEMVAVYLGTSPNPESMTKCLISPTLVDQSNQILAGSYFEEEGGEYFIGFHGCSSADQFNLTLYNFTLELNGSADAPGRVTDVNVERLRDGYDLSANLSFKAPAVTAANDPLTSNLDVVVKMNGELLETYEDVAPGATLTYENIPIAQLGMQVFSFTATSEVGEGMTTDVARFIGWADPKTPEWMLAVPGDKENTIQVTWDMVTEDVNGDTFPVESYWYQPMIVYSNGTQRTAGNGIYSGRASGFYHDPVLKGEMQGEDPNVQQFVTYYTSTYYYDKPGLWTGNTHASGHVFSNACPVGPAYTLPYAESFSNCMTSYITLHSRLGTDGAWTMTATSTNPSASPYDADKGMLVFEPEAIGDKASLGSGLITLDRTVSPELSFMYYCVPGSTDRLTIQVDDNVTIADLGFIEIGQTDTEGWTKATLSLSEYKGKRIRFYLIGECVNGMSNILVDNLLIRDAAVANLGVTSINVPAKAKVGDELTATVRVRCTGIEDMGDYTLTLSANGKEIGSVSGAALAAGEEAEHSFTTTVDVTHGQAINFTATINVDDDNEADNTLTVVTIVEVQAFPVVDEVNAVEGSQPGTVELSWSEPDPNNVRGITVTEDCEGLVANSNGMPDTGVDGDDMGGWSVIDADENTTGGSMSGKPASNMMAWAVANNDLSGSPYYASRSGEQCFVCPYAQPYGEVGNDDWLISPRLSGNAQTVSLYARGTQDQYGAETYEIWYSTTGKEKEDFIQLGEERSVYGEDPETYEIIWTQDVFVLPEGATYFAIRCTSRDVFALLIDDITFEKWGLDESRPLEHLGYNVYRDLNKLNDSTVEQNFYVDNLNAPAAIRAKENTAAFGTHTYQVTALYNLGESDLSAPATIDIVSGIEGVSADGKIGVTVSGETIIIRGAEGLDICVFTTNGTLVARTEGVEMTTIPVAPGVYLVTIGDLAAKVIVK